MHVMLDVTELTICEATNGARNSGFMAWTTVAFHKQVETAAVNVAVILDLTRDANRKLTNIRPPSYVDTLEY